MVTLKKEFENAEIITHVVGYPAKRLLKDLPQAELKKLYDKGHPGLELKEKK